jgi:hypothetical protein
MLDEEEFAVVNTLYRDAMRSAKPWTEEGRSGLSEARIDDLFRPVRQAYERLTGAKDVHQNAILHHRLSLYGPDCKKCGKPLRTPEAAFCAGCGTMPPIPDTSQGSGRDR